MRKTLALFAIVVALGVVAGAQSGSTLIGEWKPDTKEGSFKLVRLDVRMTVRQEDEVIVFEEGSMGASSSQALRYRLGVESENTYQGGRTERATATWESGRLVIAGVREMGIQRIPRHFTLVASVSPDNLELRLDETMVHGGSTSRSSRVYTRQR
jgi:hypothetical protein